MINETTPEKVVHHHSREGVNPILAIATAILIAAILSGTCLLIFLRSDTRQTVKLIQDQARSAASQDLSGAFEGLDTTSRPTESDLDTIQQNVQTAVNQLDVEADFSSAGLTDGALGL